MLQVIIHYQGCGKGVAKQYPIKKKSRSETSINLENIRLVGVHCHIGSQIFELQPYEDAVEVMLGLVKKIEEKHGYFIKEVDFGGGFGIYYSKGDKPRTTKEYCETIIKKVDEVCSRTGQDRPIITI